MRGRDYGNTIYEVTTHLIVMLFCKYCQNVEKVILAVLSWDKLEKLRKFVWDIICELLTVVVDINSGDRY